MATDLDALIAAEKQQETDFEKAIASGVTAQAKLAQVKVILADLGANRDRRKRLLDSADERLAAAKAQATAITTTGLAPVDTMLATLPGVLKLADLKAIVDAKLAAPLDAAKTYEDYVTALASADTALAGAVDAQVKSHDTEATARLNLDRAESALVAAVDQVATAATKAQAKVDGALGMRDHGQAYWAALRARALTELVNAPATTDAVTAAKKVLQDAFDAYADAIQARLTADAAIPEKQADRGTAAEQLGKAAEQVVKKLVDAVAKAKAEP